MLITSRESGRWIIPKGWPARRRPAHAQAACEAAEEAGVEGRIAERPLGHYRYLKRRHGRRREAAPCEVAVYRLDVTLELLDWPERHQRRRRWLPLDQAAGLVAEPELARLLAAVAAEPAGSPPA